MRQHLQHQTHVVHGRDCTDGIHGTGILVEAAATDTGDQGGFTDTRLQVFGGDSFIGVRNQFGFQAPAKSGGLPVFHGAHHGPHITDDIENTDLGLGGGLG